MTNNQHFSQLAILAGLGISAGLALGALIQDLHLKRPDRILTEVKTSFRKSGALDGAWIEHHPVPFKRFAAQTLVYRGGVIKHEDGQPVAYEFLADTKTGKVVDVWKVTSQLQSKP